MNNGKFLAINCKMLMVHVCWCLSVAPCCYAQNTRYKNEITLRSDNDSYLFVGQDKYYTNGLFFNYSHATEQSKLSASLAKRIWRLEVGQRMYNPQSASIELDEIVDRPFAAYLYGGGSIDWFFKNENSIKATAQLGVIGPAAKGKPFQEFIHNTFGFYKVAGWENQVKNELSCNTSFEFTHLLHRNKEKKVDVSLVSYANLGNTFSGVGIGGMLRIGRFNPLYSSAIHHATIANNGALKMGYKSEFFFFTKPMLNYVAYDASIQGRLFTHNQDPVTYGVKPIVYSQDFGLMYTPARWTFSYTMTFKSKEVRSRAKTDQYASFNVGYRL